MIVNFWVKSKLESLYSVLIRFSHLKYIYVQVDFHFCCCLNIVLIVDWWSEDDLCTILMGQSDIVKVIVFFEPS